MTLPKYLTNKESVRDISNKQEKRVTRQIASGSLWTNKGDIKDDECLIEVKFTQKKSYSLELKTVEKIFEEASKIGRIPKMVIEFLDEKKNPLLSFDAVIRKR